MPPLRHRRRRRVLTKDGSSSTRSFAARARRFCWALEIRYPCHANWQAFSRSESLSRQRGCFCSHLSLRLLWPHGDTARASAPPPFPSLPLPALVPPARACASWCASPRFRPHPLFCSRPPRARVRLPRFRPHPVFSCSRPPRARVRRPSPSLPSAVQSPDAAPQRPVSANSFSRHLKPALPLPFPLAAPPVHFPSLGLSLSLSSRAHQPMYPRQSTSSSSLSSPSLPSSQSAPPRACLRF